MKSKHNQEPRSPQEAQHQQEESSTTIIKPETVGEELYLVHLRRHEGEEVRPEDFDFSEDSHNNDDPTNTKKKRSSSIGEELWNVHMKRSRGMEPDTDTDQDEGGHEAPKDEPIHSPSRYNLRTRRSKNNASQ